MANHITETVAKVLSAHPQIQLGFVFGSAISGTMRNDSDVDIAVLASDPLPLETRLDLITELSLALKREVDVIDLFSAYGLILRQVFTGEVVLKRSSAALAMLMKRMLLDQADMEPMRRRIIDNNLQRGF